MTTTRTGSTGANGTGHRDHGIGARHDRPSHGARSGQRFTAAPPNNAANGRDTVTAEAPTATQTATMLQVINSRAGLKVGQGGKLCLSASFLGSDMNWYDGGRVQSTNPQTLNWPEDSLAVQFEMYFTANVRVPQLQGLLPACRVMTKSKVMLLPGTYVRRGRLTTLRELAEVQGLIDVTQMIAYIERGYDPNESLVAIPIGAGRMQYFKPEGVTIVNTLSWRKMRRIVNQY